MGARQKMTMPRVANGSKICWGEMRLLASVCLEDLVIVLPNIEVEISALKINFTVHCLTDTRFTQQESRDRDHCYQ